MSNDIRVSNPGATTLYDALVFKSDKPSVENTDTPIEENQIETQDVTETNQPNRGNVPATNLSFDEPIIEQDPQEQFEVTENSGDLPNIDFNNPEDLPAIQDQEQFPNETVPEDYKPETSKNHSISKAVAHFEVSLAQKGITRLAENYITKVTTSAVTKELTAVLGKAVTTTTAKKGVDVAAKITVGATKGIEKTVVDLTTKGLLGKGVATIGVKEAAKQSGNLVKGLEASAKASSEILLKGGAKKIVPNTLSALSKTSIGAGEKVLQAGLEKGTTKAVEKVIQNISEEAAGKLLTEVATKTAAKTATKTAVKAGVKTGVKTGTKTAAKTTTKTIEKVTAEAVTKATTEVATKGGVKFATKVGKAVPYINAAVGIGITAWDTYDAIEKTKDKKASTASKVLAWTTVALDVTSTVTSATGKGKPIGWAATGLSIGTSIASDYLR
jgi:hypothetical protein